MAEGQDDTEKTEDPTQKRLDDALKRGDVAKSQELNTWFIFAAAALALSAFSGSMGSGLTTTFRGLIANAHMLRADGPGLMRLVDKLGLEVLAAIAIPMLLLMLAALGANLVQHRFVWSAESVTPKFSKISPLAGIKRLFSKMAIANFVKGIFKLVERLKVMRIGQADRGAVIAVAPAHIIAVLNPADAWVIAILQLRHLGIALHVDRLGVQVPMDSILRSAGVNIHVPALVVTAKDACKGSLKRDDGAVKDAVGGRDGVARDDRIGGVTPDDVGRTGRAIFPRDIGQVGAEDGGLGHETISFLVGLRLS